jgi:hypothetical protein
LSQHLRNKRLKALREGHIQFLVATDVAARGIDVPSISHVFNYGLPMKAEDYTHRIGRTGRAGRDGMAVTFAEPRDRFRIRDIEDYTKQQFKADVIPGLEPTERPREKKPFGKFGGGFGGNGGGGFAGKSFGDDRRGSFNDRGGDRGFAGKSGGSFGGGARSGGFSGGGFAGRSDSRPDTRSEGRGFGGGGFGGEQRGNGFAGDKPFGKSFKPRTPSFGNNAGGNGFSDNKFTPKEGRSFSKPSGDFKGAPKPFAKAGFKPAGKTFAAKGPRK